MASSFTRPIETGRKSMMELANKARSGMMTTVRDYAKSGKNIVQAASGSKVKKT
jgi:hypothetical protein